MATIEVEDVSAEAYRRSIGAFHDLASRYHSDADYRRRVEADPVATFRENGIELPRGVEIRVTANTDDKLHVVLPPDPNTELGDEAITAVAGGGTASSVSSLSSLGTAGCSCVPASLATAGSLASIAP